jgi:hypothetical protein
MNFAVRRPVPAAVLTAALSLMAVAPQLQAEESPLPETARAAYERGRMAAAQRLWALAILNFTEAQQEAPGDARLLYALGLAHDKAGHELAAAALLNAYLAAAPGAPDAEAVRREIAQLEASVQAHAAKMISTLLEVAAKLPAGDDKEHLGDDITTKVIPQFLAMTGINGSADKSRPMQTALASTAERSFPAEDEALKERSSSWDLAVSAGCAAGWIARRQEPKAQEILAGVQGPSMAVEMLIDIARTQISEGDYAGAERTLAFALKLISQAEEKAKYAKSVADAFCHLAAFYAVNDRAQESEHAWNAADDFVEKNASDNDKETLRTRIAAERKEDARAGLCKTYNLDEGDAPDWANDRVAAWVGLAEDISDDPTLCDLRNGLEDAASADDAAEIAGRLGKLVGSVSEKLTIMKLLECSQPGPKKADGAP